MPELRVIAGEFRSRRLKTPHGSDVRPTPDRLREALFNVLAPSIADRVFVDAYAGTGAVGIEALSRGARRALFIERSRVAAAIIRGNLASLGIEDRAEVIVGKAATELPRLEADIVFLDPPYALEREFEQALSVLGTMTVPLVMVQHPKRMELLADYGNLRRTRVLRQGDNALSFYAVGFQTNLPSRLI
ncbi:MAG TPA: 16S rRNA (guanine(966)-N(2))-methyltransferase RsmD [Bryobacteraceae bacterium]|nr:16S rRNA (guanine(966)-N(2))-methyltransferase RsmD [Bryobacteraceae bacterium]